jgi:hypothetical protein
MQFFHGCIERRQTKADQAFEGSNWGLEIEQCILFASFVLFCVCFSVLTLLLYDLLLYSHSQAEFISLPKSSSPPKKPSAITTDSTTQYHVIGSDPSQMVHQAGRESMR